MLTVYVDFMFGLDTFKFNIWALMRYYYNLLFN